MVSSLFPRGQFQFGRHAHLLLVLFGRQPLRRDVLLSVGLVSGEGLLRPEPGLLRVQRGVDAKISKRQLCVAPQARVVVRPLHPERFGLPQGFPLRGVGADLRVRSRVGAVDCGLLIEPSPCCRNGQRRGIAGGGRPHLEVLLRRAVLVADLALGLSDDGLALRVGHLHAGGVGVQVVVVDGVPNIRAGSADRSVDSARHPLVHLQRRRVDCRPLGVGHLAGHVLNGIIPGITFRANVCASVVLDLVCRARVVVTAGLFGVAQHGCPLVAGQLQFSRLFRSVLQRIQIRLVLDFRRFLRTVSALP